MFKDIRSLAKHSIIYSIGNIATRLVGIILIPLYTRLIPVEMFGIYALFEVTIQFLQGLLLFGLPTALFRWYSIEKKEKHRQIFSTTLIFSGTLSVLLTIIIYLTQAELSHIFFSSEDYAIHFFLTALIIAVLLPAQLLFAQLRYEDRSIQFISVKLAKFLSQLIITIYLVAKIKMGILGILYGHLISDLIVLIIMLPYTIKRTTFRIDTTELKNMLRFGAPLAVSGLSSRFLNMGDRYILGALTDLKTVGIYTIGYKIANLIDTLIIQAFQYAFIPMAWKKIDADNAKRFYAKTLTYLCFLLFWISLFVAIFRSEIIHLLTKNREYWQAADIIGLIAFAICFKGMSTVVKMGLQFSKQTKFIAFSVFGAALLNVGLNLLLIPLLSIIGAALATLISFLFMLAIVLYLSNKYYPVPYEWKKIAVLAFVTLLLNGAALLISPTISLLSLLTKSGLVLSYPFLLYFMNFFDPRELYRLNGAWKKWRNPLNWKKNIKKIKL